MRNFLIFAGTSEGRELAQYLSSRNIPADVCVATEYGEEQMEEMPHIRVFAGRKDEVQITEWIREKKPLAVVDATHPYADAVSRNIQNACDRTQTEYIRLIRQASDLEKLPGIVSFPDCTAAAEWLNRQQGNILLTTGAKELPTFVAGIEKTDRIYARVLLQESVFSDMERLGLSKKQMICMQGPFSKELNTAMLRQLDAAFLVTKESGAAGGFLEKVEAAREAGATCVVIRRPVQETGYTQEEVEQLLEERWSREMPEALTYHDEKEAFENQEIQQDRRQVTLLGIGMGDPATMTLEAVQACEEADCIIGADRMLESLAKFGKPMVSMYLSEKIADYIQSHPEYRSVVIGLSGDVGFYSGAKKLTEKLKDVEVRLICGISSVVYFASKLKTSWEDMTLVSVHGRSQNLIGAVRANPKVFALASKAESVRTLASDLVNYGLGDVKMNVGADLSYPTETIRTGKACEFTDYSETGICVALIENESAGDYIVTHGMPDDAFIQGKAPMTKEEVRSVSLSKLRLTRDAVVYDVGAGTGSVSIECARMADRGAVYAVERKEDALELMRENKKKFGVSNLNVVSGLAPEALEELPAPTHVFIGGSGGNLREIVECCLRKNPQVRIVINCIALETVAETMTLLKDLAPEDVDVCCVSTARSKTLAGYHMMMGQNPVYVISFQMKR